MPKLQGTFRVGKLRVDAISDGAPERALGSFFAGVEAAAWTRALGITDPEQPVPFNFGAFLIRGDEHTVLVDSGRGASTRAMNMPGGGELPQRLAELGVAPESIDTVIHTHLHGDHCGWDVNDDAGGALMFPKATVLVSRRELEYWTGPETDRNDMSDYVRSRVKPLQAAGVISTFDGEYIFSRALTIVPTPGHTPGHCSVMLVSEGEHLLILGDTAHHPVHLEHHDWIPSVDVDPAQSRLARATVCALAADRDAVVTGGHFPILTRGRIRRSERGYRWEPL